MSGKVIDVTGAPRYFGFYRGVVVKNDDPEKLGRVTIMVPGFIEPESAWAWPLGMGGGFPQNGAWDVPKVGAHIAVMFHQGDVDEPAYLHGWYSRGMPPGPVAEVGPAAAANDIKCFETDRHLVVLDGSKGEVVIRDKEGSSVITMEKDKITVSSDEVLVKGKKVLIGGEQLLPMQGALNGESVDPFTGMQHWMLGNASQSVFVKKV